MVNDTKWKKEDYKIYEFFCADQIFKDTSDSILLLMVFFFFKEGESDLIEWIFWLIWITWGYKEIYIQPIEEGKRWLT